MKARVLVFYKDSVFDPQGNTVASSLQKNGFAQVKDVRVGKVIDVELAANTREEAKREIEKMCEKFLVNPVIESYKIELKE